MIESHLFFDDVQVELTFPTAFERLHVGFYRSKITSWMAAQEEDYRCVGLGLEGLGARALQPQRLLSRGIMWPRSGHNAAVPRARAEAGACRILFRRLSDHRLTGSHPCACLRLLAGHT